MLLDSSWRGHSIVGLHGLVNISFNEAAAILSEVLEKTITHRQITFEQFYDAMLNQGASLDVATQYTQMWRGLSYPDFAPVQLSSDKTMPTTFAEFVCNSLLPLLR